MPNLFDVPQNDQSLQYLGTIFGNVGGVLAGNNPFMGTLFLTINTIALTVGAVIVVYTTVVGLMMTAHEGEFLGKKWSGLWVPIRMVAGVASLFPSASGYSMIQVVIMWIIIQGVGAADALWSTALNSKKVGDAMSAAGAAVSTTTIGTTSTIGGIFKGLVCEKTAMMTAPGVTSDQVNLKRATRGSNFANSVNSATYAMGPNGDGTCGVLSKCNQDRICAQQGQDSPGCTVCQAQNAALLRVIPLLGDIAQSVANADNTYLTFYYTANKPSSPDVEATGWMRDYCTANNLTFKPPNATCCDPPGEAPLPKITPGVPPPEGPPCKVEKDPKPPRDFPFPRAAPANNNNMSTEGDNSELNWIRTKPESDYVKALKNSPNFIKTNADEYNTALSTAAKNLKPGPPLPPDSGEKCSAANPTSIASCGWIVAGAFFYKLVALSKQSIQSTTMDFQMKGVPPAASDVSTRYNYQAASQLINAVQTADDGSDDKGIKTSATVPGDAGSDYGVALKETAGTLSDSFMNMLRYSTRERTGVGNGGVLLSIADFGQNLLIIAQLFYVVFMAVAAVGAGFASVGTFIAIGTGNISTPLEIIKAVNNVLMPGFYLLMGALITMGALMGMYIPMIPFVVFTASVIGWFIAVIEAMVAGPIIALGIMSPGGQSEVFGRAEPSIMIIFNLFLRPTLMVFGLLVASFLAEVVATFICSGFKFMMWDVMNYAPGLVEEIIFIAIFASLIFTSMNQVFTLIHHIPERILTYLSGGTAMQYGEGQAAQAMKGAVEGAAGGVQGLSKGTAEGTAQTGLGLAKTAEENKLEKPDFSGIKMPWK